MSIVSKRSRKIRRIKKKKHLSPTNLNGDCRGPGAHHPNDVLGVVDGGAPGVGLGARARPVDGAVAAGLGEGIPDELCQEIKLIANLFLTSEKQH